MPVTLKRFFAPDFVFNFGILFDFIYSVLTRCQLPVCNYFLTIHPLFLSESQISEIIFNLVKNAIEVARDSPNGRVSVRSWREDNWLVMSIADNGAGIAEEVRATLFQPFATLKPDGNGLGLYAAGERVRELNGRILYRANVPQGTVFEVRWPIKE